MELHLNSQPLPMWSARPPGFFHPLYKGLIDLRMPILPLDPETKRPAFGKVKRSIISSVDEACDLIQKGLNLGMVCHLRDLPGSNPHGIEVLDIDSPDHGLDLTPFNGLLTRRQGETVRSHYWFRRPNPHLSRKGARKGSKHAPEGAYDLMPWLVVLPGSVHPNGSLYELYVMQDGLWVLWDGLEPLDLLNRLPLVDPEPYRPMRQVTQFDLGSTSKDERPFLTHPGALTDREYAARNYVRAMIRQGIVSHSGRGGRSTLAKIASHLMAYLCLPLETALRYLTEPLHEHGWNKQANRVEPLRGVGVPDLDRSSRIWNMKSWNACCVDGATGAPYPWTREELVEALEWGARSVPAYGVVLWEKAAKIAHAKACLRHFIAFLRRLVQLPLPDTHVAAEGLYRAFLTLYDMAEADCSKHRFCVAMSTAIKLEAVPFRKFQRTAAHTTHYSGLSMAGLEDAFLTWIVDHPIPVVDLVLQSASSTQGAA